MNNEHQYIINVVEMLGSKDGRSGLVAVLLSWQCNNVKFNIGECMATAHRQGCI